MKTVKNLALKINKEGFSIDLVDSPEAQSWEYLAGGLLGPLSSQIDREWNKLHSTDLHSTVTDMKKRKNP